MGVYRQLLQKTDEKAICSAVGFVGNTGAGKSAIAGGLLKSLGATEGCTLILC
jgi:hypothetical protein